MIVYLGKIFSTSIIFRIYCVCQVGSVYGSQPGDKVDLAAPVAEISTVLSHWKNYALLWDSWMKAAACLESLNTFTELCSVRPGLFWAECSTLEF